MYDRFRWTHTGVDGSELGDLYGLGSSLFDHAAGMVGATESDETTVGEASGINDGVEELVAILTSGDGKEEIVSALANTVFDDPRLTFEAVSKTIKRAPCTWPTLTALGAVEDEADEFTGLWGAIPVSSICYGFSTGRKPTCFC